MNWIAWVFLSATLLEAQSVSFEAEDGVLNGTSVAKSASGFSGDGYVTSLDQPEDSVEIPVQVPKEGFYTLTIHYAADNAKTNPVFVNGLLEGNRLFPKRAGFGKIVFGRVSLKAGKNHVRIGCDWGYIDVDRIEVEPAPDPIAFQISPRPVTPNASPEAARLYSSLVGWFQKRTLTGQQDERGLRLEYIAKVTEGRQPAILGLDLLRYSGAYNKPDGQIEKAMDWVVRRHGIVTLSWHWFSPNGATGEVWKSFWTNSTTFDASRVADETSAEFAAIIRDLDLVAENLKILRDAHVPVLWRPLHEAEGGWFWWGAKGPETAKRLYRLMFERFTRVHGLNNLIWIWTTTDNPDALDWYPGDDVVDILGADIYSKNGQRGTLLPVFTNIREMSRGRKMIALSETDGIPDPTAMARVGADWLWFLVWDDFIEKEPWNYPAGVASAYQNARSVHLEELAQQSNQPTGALGAIKSESSSSDPTAGSVKK